ncbi:MAG: hypothetical protein AB7V16_12910, partial [Vulcanibacillus sp.]
EGSHEGIFLITELLNQYKINYHNMIEAIDKTICYLENAPYTKNLLFKMSIRLKESTNKELEDIINDFVYALNTNWAIMLSNAIYLSIENGTNVTTALQDIIDDLKMVKKSFEENKRINIEGFSILKYLSPGLFILTIYFAIEYMDFTLDKYIHYQFNTSTGLKYFTIICVLSFLNVAISVYFKKKKFDL